MIYVTAVIVAMVWILPVRYYVNRQLKYGYDFPVFYRTTPEHTDSMYIYPPFFAWLITPIKLIPIKYVLYAWNSIETVLMVMIILCIGDALQAAHIPTWNVLFLVPFLVWQGKLNAEIGNVNVLVTWLSIVGYHHSELLWVASAIKIVPIVFVPFIPETKLFVGSIILLLSVVVPVGCGYGFKGIYNLIDLSRSCHKPRKAHYIYLLIVLYYILMKIGESYAN